MSFFAERLKSLRTELGLSMQELADQANVSKSMICKIEKDEVQPTIDVAGRLSKALGKTLSEMLHATQTTQVIFLPKEEQAVWEDAQGIKRRNISPVIEGLKIEWLHVELPPNASVVKNIPVGGQFGGKGAEKYMLVIKGTLNLKVDQKNFQLKKGDSLYFDPSYPHEFYNSGKDMVELYVVMKHP